MKFIVHKQSLKTKFSAEAFKLVYSSSLIANSFFALLVLLTITSYLLPITYAQFSPLDLSSVYEVTDAEAVDGDILIYSATGLIRANVSYTPQLFGILQDQPIMVFRNLDGSGKPVVRSGTATVNVVMDSGPIKKGDFITSSATPGKGQKATQSGYVIGIALDEISQNGQIAVAVKIEYAELTSTRSILRLLDLFNIAIFQGIQDPTKASQLVKYLVAGLMVVGSLVFSFVVFARSITKSIEAIGRNPLAKTTIQLSIVINAGLAILTILISLGVAYVILRA